MMPQFIERYSDLGDVGLNKSKTWRQPIDKLKSGERMWNGGMQTIMAGRWLRGGHMGSFGKKHTAISERVGRSVGITGVRTIPIRNDGTTLKEVSFDDPTLTDVPIVTNVKYQTSAAWEFEEIRVTNTESVDGELGPDWTEFKHRFGGWMGIERGVAGDFKVAKLGSGNKGTVKFEVIADTGKVRIGDGPTSLLFGPGESNSLQTILDSQRTELSNAISTNVSTLVAKDNSLSNSISTNVSTLVAKDNSLSNAISTNVSTLVAKDNSLSNAISTNMYFVENALGSNAKSMTTTTANGNNKIEFRGTETIDGGDGASMMVLNESDKLFQIPVLMEKTHIDSKEVKFGKTDTFQVGHSTGTSDFVDFEVTPTHVHIGAAPADIDTKNYVHSDWGKDDTLQVYKPDGSFFHGDVTIHGELNVFGGSKSKTVHSRMSTLAIEDATVQIGLRRETNGKIAGDYLTVDEVRASVVQDQEMAGDGFHDSHMLQFGVFDSGKQIEGMNAKFVSCGLCDGGSEPCFEWEVQNTIPQMKRGINSETNRYQYDVDTSTRFLRSVFLSSAEARDRWLSDRLFFHKSQNEGDLFPRRIMDWKTPMEDFTTPKVYTVKETLTPFEDAGVISDSTARMLSITFTELDNFMNFDLVIEPEWYRTPDGLLDRLNALISVHAIDNTIENNVTSAMSFTFDNNRYTLSFSFTSGEFTYTAGSDAQDLLGFAASGSSVAGIVNGGNTKHDKFLPGPENIKYYAEEYQSAGSVDSAETEHTLTFTYENDESFSVVVPHTQWAGLTKTILMNTIDALVSPHGMKAEIEGSLKTMESAHEIDVSETDRLAIIPISQAGAQEEHDYEDGTGIPLQHEGEGMIDSPTTVKLQVSSNGEITGVRIHPGDNHTFYIGGRVRINQSDLQDPNYGLSGFNFNGPLEWTLKEEDFKPDGGFKFVFSSTSDPVNSQFTCNAGSKVKDLLGLITSNATTTGIIKGFLLTTNHMADYDATMDKDNESYILVYDTPMGETLTDSTQALKWKNLEVECGDFAEGSAAKAFQLALLKSKETMTNMSLTAGVYAKYIDNSYAPPNTTDTDRMVTFEFPEDASLKTTYINGNRLVDSTTGQPTTVTTIATTTNANSTNSPHVYIGLSGSDPRTLDKKAEAQVIVVNGHVTEILITSGGRGYMAGDDVTIDGLHDPSSYKIGYDDSAAYAAFWDSGTVLNWKLTADDIKNLEVPVVIPNDVTAMRTGDVIPKGRLSTSANLDTTTFDGSVTHDVLYKSNTAGSGTDAKAKLILDAGGHLLGVQIVDGGEGYEDNDQVKINTGDEVLQWTLNTEDIQHGYRTPQDLQRKMQKLVTAGLGALTYPGEGEGNMFGMEMTIGFGPAPEAYDQQTYTFTYKDKPDPTGDLFPSQLKYTAGPEARKLLGLKEYGVSVDNLIIGSVEVIDQEDYRQEKSVFAHISTPIRPCSDSGVRTIHDADYEVYGGSIGYEVGRGSRGEKLWDQADRFAMDASLSVGGRCLWLGAGMDGDNKNQPSVCWVMTTSTVELRWYNEDKTKFATIWHADAPDLSKYNSTDSYMKNTNKLAERASWDPTSQFTHQQYCKFGAVTPFDHED